MGTMEYATIPGSMIHNMGTVCAYLDPRANRTVGHAASARSKPVAAAANRDRRKDAATLSPLSRCSDPNSTAMACATDAGTTESSCTPVTAMEYWPVMADPESEASRRMSNLALAAVSTWAGAADSPNRNMPPSALGRSGVRSWVSLKRCHQPTPVPTFCARSQPRTAAIGSAGAETARAAKTAT